MAKYCRYCGEKMNRPQDRFCYKCRKEGSAVDGFYRKIKEEDKLPLNETEQDILRADGLGTFLGICILEFAPLVFMGFDIYSLLSGGGGLISSYLRVFLIFIIVLLAYIGITAFQLFMLKKRAFRHKWKIWIYKTFESWIYFRNSSRYVVHMVGTLPKKLKRAELIANLIGKLANGEEEGFQLMNEKQHEETDKETWSCGFCGYENTYSSYACKSCGKERIMERR